MYQKSNKGITRDSKMAVSGFTRKYKKNCPQTKTTFTDMNWHEFVSVNFDAKISKNLALHVQKVYKWHARSFPVNHEHYFF